MEKKKKEDKKEVQQLRKVSFCFVISYNCGGKRYTIKSYTSTSRAVCKKIERKAGTAEKMKKRVKIIDDNGFPKVVNSPRTPSPTLGPAPKTLTLQPKNLELVSD